MELVFLYRERKYLPSLLRQKARGSILDEGYISLVQEFLAFPYLLVDFCLAE